MAEHEIRHAVKLPIAVAAEVVLQGIRIRLGRSLVTLAGVTCGIAFLASVLTASVVKAGVAHESAARTDSQRMRNLIEAETGPLRDRRLAVLALAAPDDREQRVLAACRDAGALLAWWSPAGLPLPPGFVAATDAGAAGKDSSAVVVVGSGPAPALSALLAEARQPVVAALALPADLPTGARAVSLAYQPKPEDLARAQQQERNERLRAWWITGIALAVTAIGIANAMLMAVTERFREIGTMKCLGALASFIRRIFFLESALIGFVGGVLGALLGALATLLAYGASYGFGLVFSGCAWGTLGLMLPATVVISVVLAVIAAVYPATAAARMRPADALRSSV